MDKQLQHILNLIDSMSLTDREKKTLEINIKLYGSNKKMEGMKEIIDIYQKEK